MRCYACKAAIFLLVLIFSGSALSATYKSNGGFCKMIAVKNTKSIGGGSFHHDAGEIVIMVSRIVKQDGSVELSEFRCCGFKASDFKSIDNCRLPTTRE